MKNFRVLMGASFLMATSAIGPGFLTQTTVFTQALGANFGFVILASILIDIAIQLNVWRIIGISERRAQDIANLVLPGLGKLISVLIVFGGLAFNIGNIGGGGLGLNALLGVSFEMGALLSALMAITIFILKESKRYMDYATQLFGGMMLGLIIYIAFISSPPYEEAAVKSILPDTFDILTIITLVGGTVGGYITFAGGHRLLDAGIKGESRLREISISAISGIVIASVIRIFLFLAVLGVITQGGVLDEANPPASVFRIAAGEIGHKIFGLLMLSAAITSIIGSAYTSISFLKSFGQTVERNEKLWTVGFIVISTSIFIAIGRPVSLLILAGALNGLILPLALGTLLWAAYQKKIIGHYRYPYWLAALGGIAFVIMGVMGIYTVKQQLFLF